MPSGTRPLRLVLDTNVVVAGLLWHGPPRQLLQAAIAGSAELFSSQALVDEYQGIAIIEPAEALRRLAG